ATRASPPSLWPCHTPNFFCSHRLGLAAKNRRVSRCVYRLARHVICRGSRQSVAGDHGDLAVIYDDELNTDRARVVRSASTSTPVGQARFLPWYLSRFRIVRYGAFFRPTSSNE